MVFPASWPAVMDTLAVCMMACDSSAPGLQCSAEPCQTCRPSLHASAARPALCSCCHDSVSCGSSLSRLDSVNSAVEHTDMPFTACTPATTSSGGLAEGQRTAACSQPQTRLTICTMSCKQTCLSRVPACNKGAADRRSSLTSSSSKWSLPTCRPPSFRQRPGQGRVWAPGWQVQPGYPEAPGGSSRSRAHGQPGLALAPAVDLPGLKGHALCQQGLPRGREGAPSAAGAWWRCPRPGRA